MNEHLMEIIGREIVASLPAPERSMYEFVTALEDEYASISATSEEFMQLLVKHAPHRQAAAHFSLSFGEFIQTMRKIEETINAEMDLRLSRMTWIDCTDRFRQGDTQYFYFSMEPEEK
ncbi:hypothetical protein ANABIO32_29330 [Rossellomorea marisflavi]|uniref:hypothetical protein n=1 Tax=Rossellomorea marisflavi TaxID=189381 RepID=UPI0025C849BB|nr:hypothetical protein [Rossellomorea marisflavi]GLI85208.1 hypothetical protein ANABIO32_29330 [Rossellomorea marisflavi]